MPLGLDASLVGQRIVVVGGGVMGTLHAYIALERGAEVVHLERDQVPVGASVRNFGLIWVSGRAEGRETELALRARELWQAIAEDVPGIKFRAMCASTGNDAMGVFHTLSAGNIGHEVPGRRVPAGARDEGALVAAAAESTAATEPNTHTAAARPLKALDECRRRCGMSAE